MQTISSALQASLDSITSYPRPYVVAEWKWNRFIHNVVAENDANYTAYDSFPIESILTNRLTTNMPQRMVIGEFNVYDSASSSGMTHMPISGDAEFTYWLSSERSQTMNYTRPYVDYGQSVLSNKIIAKFNTDYAKPTNINVYIDTGGGWQLAASGVSPDSNGNLILYRQSGGAWTNSLQLNHPIELERVKLHVNTMSKVGRCHLAELGATYEYVIPSDDIVSLSIDKRLEESDITLPVGHILTDVLQLTLANATDQFTPTNQSSPFYPGMHQNVEFTVSYEYDTTSGVKYIPMGKFYADNWSMNTGDIAVDIDASDMTKFFKQFYITPMLYQNWRVSSLVRSLLNRFGLGNVEFRLDKDKIVPYLWYRDELTLWQALVDIATATGAYFYIDEQNTIIWADGGYLLSDLTVDKTLTAINDVETISHDFTEFANHITVRYNIYDRNRFGDEEVTAALWESSDSMVLKADDLRSSITSTSTQIPLNTDNTGFETWPEEGVVRIEFERIKYTGKTAIGTPGHPALTGLTRGYLNTAAADHTIDISGIETYVGMSSGYGSRGVTDGSLRMVNRWNAPYDGFHYTRYGTSNSQYRVYGTRMKFTDATKHDMAGLVIHRADNGRGYYFELAKTDYVSTNKSLKHELRCYKMDGSGNRTYLGNILGYPIVISVGVEYDLDVVYTPGAGTFSVYIDGLRITTFSDSAYQQGQFGVFTRAHTVCNFDYVYAVNNNDTPDLGLFRVHNVDANRYLSTYAAQLHKTSNLFFEEYAPIVREVKEMSVEYQVYPALWANLLITNKWSVLATSKKFNSFGAEFVLENLNNTDSVVHGQDYRTFGGDEINQAIIIYGGVVIKTGDEVKTFKNDSSIRRHGKHELELSTPWLQSLDQATSIGNFIEQNWSDAMDVFTVEIAPQPHLQIGDIVAIDWAEKGWSVSDKYIIIGISLGWADGVTQSLTLRKI